MPSPTNTPARNRDNSQGEERAARPGRAFTWKDAKELAGAILALWLAGLLIGIFYFAQLSGKIG